MAIDPSISLDVRPPQFNIQIPQPLQQFGQILSLQGLMQQQQLGRLQLLQAQTNWEERQRLNRLIFGAQPPGQQPVSPEAITPSAAVLSAAPVIPPVQPTAPDLTYPSFPAIPGAPSPALAVPPAATAPMPTLAAAMTPPAPAAAAAPAVARPTGQIQMPGEFPVPDFRQWIQVAPTLGPQMADTYLKTIKSYYDMHDSQFKDQQNTLKRAAGLANSIVDEPTKFTAIANAFNEGIISPQERDRLRNVPFDDSIWKSWQQGALSGAEGLQNQRDQIRLHMEQLTKAFEYAKQPYELRTAQAGAQEAETKAAAAQFNQDASTLAAAYARGPEEGKAALATLPQSRQQPFLGATTAEEIYARAHPQESAQFMRARAVAEATGRQQAELTRLAPTIESVLAGKTRLQDVNEADQKTMMPALIERGFGQPGTPTETTGGQFGKLISDAERERLGDYDRAKTVLQNSLSFINGYVKDKEGKDTNQKTVDYMGPVEGLKAFSPWATLHQNVQSALITQQQQLKKFITNGSLRGLTEKTLDQMFPTITNTPEHATSVIYQLMKTVEDEKQAYLRDLSDKVIPAGLKSTATTPPETPAAGKPTYQTFEKTGAPGAKVTGSFTIGGGAAVAPPGKIVVLRPASLGGGQFYLDSDKWPEYQKRGFTRAE